MVTDRIKELLATKSKLAQLESEIAAELRVELGQLPAYYGFASVKTFISAVKAAAGKHGARGVAPGKPAKRTRAKITDETRAKVKQMVEEGKTGAEIAKTVGISLPSVQNIKKALGLVKP